MGIIGYNNWDYVIIGYNLTINNGLYNSWDLMGVYSPQRTRESSRFLRVPLPQSLMGSSSSPIAAWFFLEKIIENPNLIAG